MAKKCCNNECKTVDEMLRNHLLPIGIIGDVPEEVQIAHFKAMVELFDDK